MRWIKIKKIIHYLIIVSLFIGLVLGSATKNIFAAPELSADGAALMDVDSKRIIFTKNPNKELPMASTTKVMTGIIAVEKDSLGGTIKASEEASEVIGSSIYLKEDEKLSMENMLYGLMLESGNDAAHAIAEHISGDVDSFNNLMNKRARELGAVSTNFQNPHGLPAKNHYTTAKDLLILSRHAISQPVLARIFSTKNKIIPGPDEEVKFRFLRNTNKLLGKYPGADGVKTGWTEKAGRCLIFSASKDGRQLVGTLLNAPEMYEDAQKLLDWGFSSYEQVELLEKGEEIERIEVKNSDEEVILLLDQKVVLPLKESERNKISFLIKPESTIEAPIEAGKQIASLEVVLDGEVIFESNLKAKNEVESPGFWDRLKGFIFNWG